jgi:hypothetical protein
MFCNKYKEVQKPLTRHKNFNISMTYGALMSCNKSSMTYCNNVANFDELQQNDKIPTRCNFWQVTMTSCDFWQAIIFDELRFLMSYI